MNTGKELAALRKIVEWFTNQPIGAKARIMIRLDTWVELQLTAKQGCSGDIIDLTKNGESKLIEGGSH